MKSIILALVYFASISVFSSISIGPLRFFSSLEKWNGKVIHVTAYLKKRGYDYYIYAMKDYADIEENTEVVKLLFPKDKKNEWTNGCVDQYVIVEGQLEIEYIGLSFLNLTRKVHCPEFMKIIDK